METQNHSLTLDQLIEKKFSLTSRLKEIQAELSKFALTANRIRQKPHSIPENILVERGKLTHEYNLIQNNVIELNKHIRRLNEQPDYFRVIVKEYLPKDVYDKLINECESRRRGHPPAKLEGSIDVKYTMKLELYRRAIDEYYTYITKARRELTKYIELNSPDRYNGLEEFLKKISPVNKELPTLDYMQRKRRELGI